MARTWAALLILCFIAPLQLGLNKEKWKKVSQPQNDESKVVIVGRECDNPETLHRVEKNSQAIRGKSVSWGVAVKDEGKGYCGFEMISGAKVKRVDGDKPDDLLNAELHGFFMKRAP